MVETRMEDRVVILKEVHGEVGSALLRNASSCCGQQGARLPIEHVKVALGRTERRN